MPERLLIAIREAGSDPWIVGMLAFFGASFAGLATQLRNGKTLTFRSILAATMNSGIIGMVIFLIGYQESIDNLPLLVGTSILSGIGGSTMLDFIIGIKKMWRNRTGITITIKGDDK